MPNAYYKLKTKEELQDLLDKCNTLAEFMRELGYSGNRGNSINGLKLYLDKLGLDYSKYSVHSIYAHEHPK